MSFSERFGPETAGFVEAMSLIIASDDVVAEEEIGLVQEAISDSSSPVFGDLEESDKALVLEYTKARALEIVAGSYATVVGTEDDVMNFFALLKQIFGSIALASGYKNEIIRLANSLIAGDGVVTEEESLMLASLDTCLTHGAEQALKGLFEISTATA